MMDLRGSWEYIERIARSRLASNKTTHHVSGFGEEIEVMGVAGEIAARRFLGLSEKVHLGFDRGSDLEFVGFTVDVKATRMTAKMEHRFLQWPVWKQVKADIVLMTAVDVRLKAATVLGFCWKLEIERAPINVTRKFPCREIPVVRLHPMWELFQIKQKAKR
jgi:hypothetical protein